MKKLITTQESAEILEVSEATVKNWITHNYLFPIKKNNKQVFAKSEVVSLKKKIEQGEIARLNSRANKRNSSKKFIPQEYLSENGSRDELSNLINYMIDNSLSIDIALFYLAINVLHRENFIYKIDIKRLLEFESNDFKNEHVLNILKDNFIQLDDFIINDTYLNLLNFNLPNHQDILGLIYQSVKSEGDKAKQGSYYTPKKIVDNIITEHIKESSIVLDPCCGTGQFLLNINKKILDPNNIYGFDIDPIAVNICKINLLRKYKTKKFNPKIFKLNSLTGIGKLAQFNKYEIPEKFDFIFTNPPWGQHYDKNTLNELKKKYPAINSMESYSYFLLKGISLLKSDGVLSYVLPESILNIKTHRDIRKIILDTANILKIEKLNRAFTNVFTNVIRMDLTKSNKVRPAAKIIGKTIFTIKQERFLENTDFIFDIEINEKDYNIIDKAYSREYKTLKNNAEWALGIVTGNNKKFIRTNKSDGFEEIYRGRDVNGYHLSAAKNFVKFEPEKFQQVAPVHKYRADEKLIYRFISNRLIFAYDNQKKLTLNSANILIPKIPNYPIKVILALFNSSLYRFIYFKKFNSIKILRGNLEKLPLPIFEETINQKVISMVDEVLSKNKDINNIDSLIFDLFKITAAERDYIIKNIH